MASDTLPSDAHPSEAVPLLINGREVRRSSEGTAEVISPASETLLWHFTSVSKAEAVEAVEAASAAFPTWSKTKATERRDIFLRAATLLEQRAEEFAQFEAKETGATEFYSLGFDIPQTIETLKEVAGKISSIYGAVPTGFLEGSNALILKEPYGVILAIAPWNAPYILGVRSIAYALATGNTCILKGSELSPRCYWAIGDLFTQAGLPAGCLNVLYHQPSDAAEITSALIQHPAIRKINFTGSTRVGEIIAQTAGKFLKPCLLELGGKASAIVLEDANIELAAMQCAQGAFLHSGQICMSTERILVHHRIFEQFKSALQKAQDNIAPGSEPALVLAMSAGVEKNRRLIAQASSAGAEIITREKPSSGNGGQDKHRLSPTIVSGVDRTMDIYYEESFGPTVSLIRVKSEEEAISIANDTEYGLSSAIFSEDLRRALNIAKELESGAVHINSMTVHDNLVLPHGGVKASGWGRFNAQWGLEEFLKTKTITFH
ncbi:aldehyde dehydrogenase domain-containing protein [Dactylonectria estremocensis]|uniref:Aldehyde dehydrogenase domain-containing protein n=1 Tax=Dactylonectria estremocensis TaxID=1079267 RepID=A0A9P9E3L4_9HYPO|nr:aldehyde dehydrogenase domain-containing protein [Dactylonectria estremocensis]